MNLTDHSTVIQKEGNANTGTKVPSFVYPVYVNLKKGAKKNNEHNESMSDSNLDSSLEINNKLERQCSVISSIDAKSNSKRHNEDSFLSYLKSEESNPRASEQIKVKDIGKVGNDDQFEMVNFIPGAIIKKQLQESRGSPNQSSESINAKNHHIEEVADSISNKNQVELADSKIIEAKSNLIFDKYIKQFNTSSQSKDKEDVNSSYEQIQNMCLPKGLIGSDSLIKEISLNNAKLPRKPSKGNKPKEKQIDTEVLEQGNQNSYPSDYLNYNKVNNIHINNFTFQPYPPTQNIYQQSRQQIPAIIPQYPYMIPNSYVNYNYPLNTTNPIHYPYKIDNSNHYQMPNYNPSNLIYQTKPQPQFQGNFMPSNQQIIINNNSNYANMQKNDISLNIIKAVRDQNECRLLQIQLDKDPTLSHKILPQLLHYFVLFCSDPFGNYLVQKILSCLFEEEIDQIVYKILEHFNDLSMHNFGTRVIQKLIEVGEQQHLNNLAPSIRDNLYTLYRNQNGIHVILKFMTKCKNTQFIFDFIHSNISLVSKNKDGCCLIQKILEGSLTEQKVSLYILV